MPFWTKDELDLPGQTLGRPLSANFQARLAVFEALKEKLGACLCGAQRSFGQEAHCGR